MQKTALNRRSFLLSTGLVTGCVLTGVRSFAAQQEQDAIFDLDPAPENPRNSEGAFITLNSGRILFLYTRFHGGADDASPARIVSIYSDDDGRTWSREPKVEVETATGANVMSVSLLRLKGGAIALFYLLKNSLIDCKPLLRISTDEGKSWSEPKAVTEAPGYFVLNNDRVIQLQSGRLVVPLAFHRSRGANPKTYRSFDGRALAIWMLSDDEGKSWQEADDWWALPLRTRTGLQEPGVVELADGRVFSWMRTDAGVQYGSYSEDQGKRWSAPERTEMISPVSPASIKRLPNSERLLAVYNDHSGRFSFEAGKRTPLVAALSDDHGRTWPRRKLIESAPDGWYCYTAIHFLKEAMLLAYCAGDKKVGGLNRLRLRRCAMDWNRFEPAK